MTYLLSAALLVSALYSLSAYASSDTNNIENEHLELCSTTDINVIFILDVGRANLYLPDCNILDYSEFMLAIRYNRSFTAEEFTASSDELIARNNSADTYRKVKPDLDLFNSQYQAVKKGDEYRISYITGSGLRLHKNGQLISSNDNRDLARAYFKVWFGNKPFHLRMKNDLLKNINIIPDEQSKK